MEEVTDHWLATIWECPNCDWENREEGDAQGDNVTCVNCGEEFELSTGS